jgi:hypothetical protein
MIPLVTRVYSINSEGKVSKRTKASGNFLGSCLTSDEEVGCDHEIDNILCNAVFKTLILKL